MNGWIGFLWEGCYFYGKEGKIGMEDIIFSMVLILILILRRRMAKIVGA